MTVVAFPDQHARTRAKIDRALADFKACGWAYSIIEDRGSSVLIWAVDPEDRGALSGGHRILIDPAQFGPDRAAPT